MFFSNDHNSHVALLGLRFEKSVLQKEDSSPRSCLYPQPATVAQPPTIFSPLTGTGYKLQCCI